MKTFKKTLCLVLALVMIVGTLAISASATDFNDDATITHKEAVDVLTGIGVINGKDGNKFDPKGTLTREEAAKIIVYLLEGDDASKFASFTSKFADVNGRWSGGYVDYCAAKGVIVGDENGKFNPLDSLTGAAFAKMILVALGYDAKIEGFTGTDWLSNVKSRAVKVGLDEDLSIDYAKAITRDDACQMAFNALTAKMVKYAQSGTTIITTDGTTIITGGSDASYVDDEMTEDKGYLVADDGDTETGKNDKYTQFCEEYFSKLKLAEDYEDDFARPAEKWIFDGDEIASYADAAKATYTKKFDSKTLYGDLGLSVLTKNYKVYDNGDEISGNVADGQIDKDDTDFDFSANGRLAQVYKIDNNNYRICLIETYFGQIEDYTEADDKTNEDAYITIDGDDFETDKFNDDNVDDYVIYTYSYKTGKIKSVDVPELASNAKLTSRSSSKFTAGGKTYEYSANVMNKADQDLKSMVDVYLDGYGFAINVETYKAASSDYAVVLDKKVDDGGWSNDDAKYYAKLLYVDGTTGTVEIEDTDYDAVSDYDIVSYTKDDDNVYDLDNLANYDDTGATSIDKGTPAGTVAGNGFKGNSKTIYLVQTLDDDEKNPTYKAYVGYKAVPSISAGKGTIYTKRDATYASVVFVAAATEKDSTDTTNYVFFVMDTMSTSSTEDTDYGTYYTVKGVCDGKVNEYMVKDGSAAYAALYANNDEFAYVKSVTKNSKGVVTGIGASVEYNITESNSKFDGDVISLGSNAFDADSDTQTVTIKLDGDDYKKIKVLSGISALAKSDSSSIVYTVDSDNEALLTNVFVFVDGAIS